MCKCYLTNHQCTDVTFIYPVTDAPVSIQNYVGQQA